MFSPRLLAIAVIVLATNTGRAIDPEPSNKALERLRLSTWKVSKVEPAAVGNGGSLLVVRPNVDGFSTDAMWLGVGTDTNFTINGWTDGVRVSDVTEGMEVTFEFGGLAKTKPPKAVGLTSVHVSGKVAIDPDVFRHKAIRRAWNEMKFGPAQKN